MTLQGFKKQYQIIPDQWGLVKCIAGCVTDEVPGIKGIGEKTVIKYLTGELKETTKAFKKIEKQKTKYIKRNYPLVVLPLEGTDNFKLRKDKISKEGWNEVVEKLGLKSIKNKVLINKKRKGLL